MMLNKKISLKNPAFIVQKTIVGVTEAAQFNVLCGRRIKNHKHFFQIAIDLDL